MGAPNRQKDIATYIVSLNGNISKLLVKSEKSISLQNSPIDICFQQNIRSMYILNNFVFDEFPFLFYYISIILDPYMLVCWLVILYPICICYGRKVNFEEYCFSDD